MSIKLLKWVRRDKFSSVRANFMSKPMLRCKKGFTLIELLVVIAIIALLLSILLPSLRTAKAMARRIVCSTNMRASSSGFFIYASNNDDELPISMYMMPRKDGQDGIVFTNMDMPFYAFHAFQVDSTAPANAQYPDYIKRWTSDHAGWDLIGTKRMYGFGSLYDAKIIENPKSFYCPSVPRESQDRFRYETYSDGHAWPWWDIDNADESGWQENVIVSYYYLPQSRKKKMLLSGNGVSVEAALAALKATNLSSGSVLSVDLMAQQYFAHEIGKKRGVNALLADGSVSYNHDSAIFDHEIWDNDNVHQLPAVFRAVIKGLEGNSSYMNMITSH